MTCMATVRLPRKTVTAREESGNVAGDLAPKPARPGFIAGPLRDSVFLIAAPLVAIVAFLPFYFSDAARVPLPAGVASPEARNLTSVFLSAFVCAHLFIVFFRSHVNPKIFRLQPYRFTVVPAVLFVGCWASQWVLVATMIVGVSWDVYHSAMQTIGIARIYDMKAGNDPLAGRRPDQVLNLLLYIGPILGGVSLMLHLAINEGQLNEYAGVKAALFDSVPFERETLTNVVLALGTAFLLYYVFSYYRRARDGYRVSCQKVALLVVLAAVSIVCWGFNSFGEAFFVVNFFHALQYFFIV